MDEGIKKLQHMAKWNSAMAKKGILPCETTLMDPEGIMLSAIKSEKEKYCMISWISYMES